MEGILLYCGGEDGIVYDTMINRYFLDWEPKSPGPPWRLLSDQTGYADMGVIPPGLTGNRGFSFSRGRPQYSS
jgi:hypothetical protein